MTNIDAALDRVVARMLVGDDLSDTGRRHRGICVGPTRGHQPRVWAYLFELLVEEGFVAVTDNGPLPRDADEFADKMVLRTATICEAFNWLVRHRLVDIRTVAGELKAFPNPGALADFLRRQQEQLGARASDSAALTYFQARHMFVRLGWIGRVLGEEEDTSRRDSPPGDEDAP